VDERRLPRCLKGHPREIATKILREASRRGMGALYMSTGRDSMGTTTV
jgi:hypothetical protein